jgi:RNA polymerase sigma-70 factor (ECF subfamily)
MSALGLVLDLPRAAWPGSTSVPAVAPGARDDAELVAALRRGEEDAFAELVDRYHPSLLRTAAFYVRDRAVAEEVVQETWLGVLQGVDRFEGRSSLATWIFRIATNRAKSRGAREQRQVPISALSPLAGGEGGEAESEVGEDRFLPIDDPRHPQQWAVPPRAWPHERVLARETIDVLRAAVDELPPAQQVVLGLRDVDGWSAEEVCDALEITPGNQRVLLHRARSRLRAALEGYLWEG